MFIDLCEFWIKEWSDKFKEIFHHFKWLGAQLLVHTHTHTSCLIWSWTSSSWYWRTHTSGHTRICNATPPERRTFVFLSDFVIPWGMKIHLFKSADTQQQQQQQQKKHLGMYLFPTDLIAYVCISFIEAPPYQPRFIGLHWHNLNISIEIVNSFSQIFLKREMLCII